MHRRSKLLLAGTAAALALGAATEVAQARRFEFSGQTFKITWTELKYIGGNQEIVCPVTYEGSFHSRTISKVSGSLIGYVYNAQIGSCSGGGSERYLAETLPWHLRYLSFQGTLPAITAVKLAIVGLSWQVEGIAAFLGSCLFRSTAERPLVGTVVVGAGGRITQWREEETSQIPHAGGTGLNCPPEIGIGVGTATMTTREGAGLTIRLIA